MSGPYRQLLGPVRARLIQQISEANALTEPQLEGCTPSEKVTLLRRFYYDVSTIAQKLNRSIELIEHTNRDWSQLLSTMSDQPLANEETLYRSFLDGTADAPGFIEALLDGKDKQSEIEIRLTEIKFAIESHEKLSLPSPTPSGRESPAGLTHRPTPRIGTNSESHFRMPKIELPEFDGEETKFKRWWSVYNASVHSKGFSNIEKFSFLATKLTGKAAQVIIEGMDITDENYPIAIDLLQERFGISRTSKRMLYHRLRELPKTTNRFENLQDTVDEIEKILGQLTILDVNVDQENLIEEVLSKLPQSVIDELERERKSDADWSMFELRQYLKEIVKYRKRGHTVCDTKSLASRESKQKVEQKQFLLNRDHKPVMNNDTFSFFTKTANPYISQNELSKPPYACIFCKQGHYHDQCKEFATVEARKNQLRKQHVCFKCFKPGHVITNCPSSNMLLYCFYCKQKTKHHSALCLNHPNRLLPRETRFQSQNTWSGANRVSQQPRQTNPSLQHKTRSQQSIQSHARTRSTHFAALTPQSQQFDNYSECNEDDYLGQDNHCLDQNISASSPELSKSQSHDAPLSYQPKGGLFVTSSMSPSSDLQTKTMLLTATVHLVNPIDPSKVCKVRAFLDTGSEITYISTKVAKALNLEVNYSSLSNVQAFGSSHTIQTPVDHVFVNIKLCDGSTVGFEAHATKTITGTLVRHPLSDKDLSVLQTSKYDIPFADDLPTLEDYFVPDLLIGINCSLFMMLTTSPENIVGHTMLPSGLMLIPSKLGVLIGGSNELLHTVKNSICNDSVYFKTDLNMCMPALNQHNSPDRPLIQSLNLKDLWSLEKIGIDDCPYTYDDDVALHKFNKSIKFEQGRYHLCWPWIDDAPNLPTNRELAYSRFSSQIKKTSLEILKACHEVITDQYNQNIIERVADETDVSGLLHYIPHFPVITPGKTTKTRVVYDASSKSHKDLNSLNDCLYRGPILLPDLVGILIRFRTHKIALISDIQKAFLQLVLHTDQRDCTRFFWVKTLDGPDLLNPDNIQIYRFTRVLFGAKPSPSMLNLTIDHHLAKYGSPIADQIRKDIYVDNCITGTDSVSSAISLYITAKNIFQEASMNLREWLSNSTDVMESIPEKDRAKVNVNTKVLGVSWNPTTDTLNIATKNLLAKLANSKRHAVEVLSSVFDPLGLISPVTLAGKMFIQKLWIQKYHWDDALPKKLNEELNDIIQSVAQVSSLHLSRYLPLNQIKPVVLVAFSDGSKDAYAAVVYAVSPGDINSDSMAQCQNNVMLLMSKTRLKPTKGLTIPRMELLGVLIAVRLLKFVKQQLQHEVQTEYLFTDSECVLHWIKSLKSLPIFIENRMREIRNALNVKFRFVESAQNPADIATRSLTWNVFMERKNLWFNGPFFLTQEVSKWPVFTLPEFTPEKLDILEDTLQRKVQTLHIGKRSAITCITSKSDQNQEKETEHCFKKLLNKVSSLPSLYRITSYVLRFLKNKIWKKLKPETQKKFNHLSSLFKNKTPTEIIISTNEMKNARYFWDFHTQHDAFTDVYESFYSKKQHSLIREHDLFIDNKGLLRKQGRIQNSGLPYNTVHPKLLPSQHVYTDKLINHIHKKRFHDGIQSTLAEIRSEYWPLKGRQTIRRVISKCIICTKTHGFPLKLPNFAQLPYTRLKKARPFQFIGIDYFGPLTIKANGEHKKIWVCLFACFVTRAVHLEPVSDLTTNAFLKCFRRYISRRGRPEICYSDNATTFISAAKAVHQAWQTVIKDPEVINYCSSEEITWRFITEMSPWKGGAYERLIGIVKQKLKQAVGRRILHFEDMLTYLAESESIVNSRPLTFLYEDGKSLQILRPIDFLLPYGFIGTENLNSTDSDDPDYIPTIDSTGKLINIWKTSLISLDGFWKLFQEEYIPSLLERYQKEHRQKHTTKYVPKRGSVVLIHNNNIPRGWWQLGIIYQLLPEHNPNTAILKIPSGKSLKRPLNLLFPLEIEADPVNVISDKSDSNRVQNTPITERRVTRSMTKRKRNSAMFTGLNVAKSALLMLMLIYLQFAAVIATVFTKCPEGNITTAWDTVASQTCVKKGIVVKRMPNGKFCYIVKTCNTGHLRDDEKFFGECRKTKCRCPDWTDYCSHNTKPPALDASTLKHYKEILDLEKPQVCSFQPSTKCHNESLTELFKQVQLYDNSTHYVRELSIRMKPPLAKQYECIGEGEMTGTSDFCELHICHEGGKRFCFYKSNDVAYLITEEGKIPVRAWGTIPVTYYPEKDSSPTAPTCKFCKIICIKGGIKLELEEKLGQVHVCSEPACYLIPHPKPRETLIFPPEINLQPHEISAKIYADGYLIKHLGIRCESMPYCETIDCYICLSRVQHVECTPYYIMIYLFIFILFLIYFGSKALYYILRTGKVIVKALLYLLYGKWFILRGIYRYFKRPDSKMKGDETVHEKTRENNVQPSRVPRSFSTHRDRRPYTLRPSKVVATTTIILLATMFTESSACSEATSLTATTQSCIQGVEDPDFANIKTCTFDQTTRIALVPQGQTSCLVMKKPDGSPLGTLRLKIQKITLRCNSKNEFFTRSFKMKVESSHRCHKAGSCSGAKCQGVTTQTKVDELKGIANDSPGFTFCTSSCQCIECDECFYCKPSCLFYRLYAMPASETVYEVTSCTTWQLEVKTTIEIQTASGTTIVHKLTLIPGVKRKWKNIDITLIGTVLPPAPLLNSKFISDSIRTAKVETSASGQPVPGTVGSLQCSNEQNAKNFNCYLAHNLCSCQPQDYKVSCTCANMAIEPIFQDNDAVLPLKTQGLTISSDGKEIQAEFNTIASLEVQLTLKDVKLSFAQYPSTCTIELSSFKGCYSCTTGSKIVYTCRTDKGSTQALIECGEGTFTTLCSPSGVLGTETMTFSHADINEKCDVTCPAGKTHFSLNGTLSFQDKNRLGTIDNILAKGRDGSDSIDGNMDWMHVLGWLTNNWYLVILIFILVLVTVFMIIPMISACLTSLQSGIHKYFKKVKSKFKKKQATAFKQETHKKKV